MSRSWRPNPPAIEINPTRNAYFGDLHIHTGYSFDAFLMFATKATPDDAYRFGKGEAIDHPLGFPMQLKSGPLDFYAVTDHAGSLGLSTAMTDPTSEVSKLESTRELLRAENGRRAPCHVSDRLSGAPG